MSNLSVSVQSFVTLSPGRNLPTRYRDGAQPTPVPAEAVDGAVVPAE
jgi:hypothetical protein